MNFSCSFKTVAVAFHIAVEGGKIKPMYDCVNGSLTCSIQLLNRIEAGILSIPTKEPFVNID